MRHINEIQETNCICSAVNSLLISFVNKSVCDLFYVCVLHLNGQLYKHY